MDFKGYILSREEFAHAPIAPWNNQEGDPLGEPLTYLPNPYFCGQMYNNGDPALTTFEMLKRNVYIFWSKWQILRSKGYCLKYNVTINGIHYDMVLFCEKNRLLTEISEEIIGFVYRADNSSLLKPPIIYGFADLCAHSDNSKFPMKFSLYKDARNELEPLYYRWPIQDYGTNYEDFWTNNNLYPIIRYHFLRQIFIRYMYEKRECDIGMTLHNKEAHKRLRLRKNGFILINANEFLL